MEVVQFRPNDENEAECSGLWHAALRHTKVENMVSNSGIENAAEGVS